MTDLETLRERLRSDTLRDESTLIEEMLDAYPLSTAHIAQINREGGDLIRACRARPEDRSLLDAFLQQFGLANGEGVALMCLAESLLRIPDADTADALISEKLLAGSWEDHLRQSDSMFVNASTWALMLTGRLVRLNPDITEDPERWFGGLLARLGEPVIRGAMQQAMRIMGGEFVLGRTLKEAAENGSGICSFDMLGEGARTAADAQRYFDAYAGAIAELATRTPVGESGHGGPHAVHGISIKLSALHPRYELHQAERCLPILEERLLTLARAAAAADMNLTLDAEEAARLDLSLTLFERIARRAEFRDWRGLGLAIQCYGRRALPLIDWLVELARDTGMRFMVRFVKGAYWDTEIKRAQELGLDSYPVFTRKLATDLSYLSCAARALAHPEAIYPQFATHNAHTVCALRELAGDAEYEFQRLHGMGELVFDEAQARFADLRPVRVYAPVGAHKDLLAYLVRRLLENGANSSFVNRFLDADTPVEFLLRDPARTLRSLPSLSHPDIAPPRDMFGSSRRNSAGTDLEDTAAYRALQAGLESWAQEAYAAQPLAAGNDSATTREIINPATAATVGTVVDAAPGQIDATMVAAAVAQRHWDALGGTERAECLRRAADLLREHSAELLALLMREAGKTLDDALAELREAEDFCRYYAAQAAAEFTSPMPLPGPTGETNTLSLHGRGVFVTIAPWNFPLAIFIGQTAAALAAGNSVVAKPAEQTPLIAYRAVQILHAAGVPQAVLALLPGSGRTIGAALVSHPHTAGVAMTGSTATARIIHRALAERDGPILPLIAETGGQNAMFVDSTALPEQVVDDLVRSAFRSAGQRCSAVRVLFVQDDVADTMLTMLKGAMDELRIGDPWSPATDVGPIIDADARDALLAHIDAARVLHRCPLPDELRGTFVAPTLIEIDSIAELDREHFGPVLHVVRYAANELDDRLTELAATGYGLTLGIHSRLTSRAEQIFANSLAGNVYINRDTVGAVVGVQPFGGSGLSGTGPKAGGPHYLHRFAVERVRTDNVTARGGNTDLFRLTTA